MIALMLGRMRGLSKQEGVKLVKEAMRLPGIVGNILREDKKISEIADRLSRHKNALYLGRGYNYPVALEGALKLKEISYVHAEGYPAAEMKHGPIALIDDDMPVIVVATKDFTYDKIMSNISEIKARNGWVLSIVTSGDKMIANLSDEVIEVPEIIPSLMPIVNVIPLQLLAYHIAVNRGCNVDQPRNLAKSVTVE
jgi:glucosamine--fructose-6-phosphate aminotransferase (isomerizing)